MTVSNCFFILFLFKFNLYNTYQMLYCMSDIDLTVVINSAYFN